MTRLLLVEDDRLIGEMIRLNLTQDGYDVTWCRDGTEAASLLEGGFELLLLDVMLPGRTGFELARDAREAGVTAPILMLTARSDTSSKVTGLDAGADDYLTKPFHMPELLARVRALLRRPGAEPAGGGRRELTLGQGWVDLDSGQAETLQGTETLDDGLRRLVELLSRRRGQDLTPAEIAEELAHTGLDVSNPLTSPDGVREAIHRLRQLFEPEPERPRHFVHTDHGVRFES